MTSTRAADPPSEGPRIDALFAGTGARRHPRRARWDGDSEGDVVGQLDGGLRVAISASPTRTRQAHWWAPDEVRTQARQAASSARRRPRAPLTQIAEKACRWVSKRPMAPADAVQYLTRIREAYAESSGSSPSIDQRFGQHDARRAGTPARPCWELNRSDEAARGYRVIASGDEDDPCLEPRHFDDNG